MPAFEDRAIVWSDTSPLFVCDTALPATLPELGRDLAVVPELQSHIARPMPSRRKYAAAIAASCLLHVAVAAVLLAALGRSPAEIARIEGSDQSGRTAAGNATDDQSIAGLGPDVTRVTLITMLDPRPVETVRAQTAPSPEALLPVDEAVTAEPVAERLQAFQETPVQPAEMPQRIAPEPPAPEPRPAPDPRPEILTSEQTAAADDQAAVETPAKAEPVEPAIATPVDLAGTVTVELDGPVPADATERAPADSVETARVEPASQPSPADKSAVSSPAAKAGKKPTKRVERKPRTKPARAVAGSKKSDRSAASAGVGGRNRDNARRGIADGKENGESVAGKGGKTSPAAGNAAVSNYPGKVAAKLRRASRGFSGSTRRGASGNAQVSFTVGRAGGVAGVRLARSSGSASLDQAALAVVRRAAPFPAIPPEARRSSWSFSVPIGPF